MFSTRIITEKWNRVVAVPYLLYMPEKDRLLMLVSCDYPHRPMILQSEDHGKTWSQPRDVEKPSDDPKHHIGVSLTYLGNGKVILGTETLNRYFSEDYGQTWSDPAALPPMSDGQPWEQWDPYLVDKGPAGKVARLTETAYSCTDKDAPAGAGYYAEIRFSFDSGQTWDPPIRVPQWSRASEIALCRAANGDIVAACRTEPPEQFRNEIDHYCGLEVSISKDNGCSWSQLKGLYEWGRHHPCMVLMPDDRMVMTYVVRKGYPDTADGFPQFGIEAIISGDHGKTWNLDEKIVLAKWVGNRKGENGWWASCQSTSSILLPEGSILTAYGTGYRSQQADTNYLYEPRDVGLVEWRP